MASENKRRRREAASKLCDLPVTGVQYDDDDGSSFVSCRQANLNGSDGKGQRQRRAAFVKLSTIRPVSDDSDGLHWLTYAILVPVHSQLLLTTRH